jgi:ATP-binding cassette, subfamily B, bacterial MsbA
MKKASKQAMQYMSEIVKVIRETLDCLRVVKAFTREARERQRFRKASAEYSRRSVAMINLDAFFGPLMELLGISAVGLALLAGAYLVIREQTYLFGFKMSSQQLGFESLLAMYMLLAAIADPVRKLSSVFSKIQSAGIAADRILTIMDAKPAVSKNPDGPIIPKHAKSIDFKHVCFSYETGRDTLLDIDLSIKFGETVAIVGPNGSGKSTLIGLLSRFYDPNFGTVSIDGVPIQQANLRSLRKQIGIVTQDTILFDTSVKENICFGLPGAIQNAELYEAAAQQAYAHEFITTLSDGYETIVGDKGSKLSGGQRQRIALARAILRNPRILILDEFTSAIDAESELKIHSALKEFVKGRTTFLITHRLSTLDIADKIIVMDEGRIVANGKHDHLYQTCALYRRLYESHATGSPARLAAA